MIEKHKLRISTQQYEFDFKPFQSPESFMEINVKDIYK